MIYYLVGILVTPMVILLSMITGGAMLPKLGSGETWTIQYLPMVLSSLMGVLLTFLGKRIDFKRSMFYGTLLLNITFFVFFLLATYNLWGEKF